MKERRKNTNKEIIKTVILKTVRDIIIFNILVLLIGYFFWTSWSVAEMCKIFCSMSLISNIVMICIFGATHTSEEKDKIKIKMVENIFRKDNSTVVYPKVFPKKGHFKQRTFFEHNLPKIADYYANLYTSGQIEIIAKLKDNKKILHIENITKKDFIDAYEVLETTLTDIPN